MAGFITKAYLLRTLRNFKSKILDTDYIKHSAFNHSVEILSEGVQNNSDEISNINETINSNNAYVLNEATDNRLGGVIIGEGLNVTDEGVLSTENSGIFRYNEETGYAQMLVYNKWHDIFKVKIIGSGTIYNNGNSEYQYTSKRVTENSDRLIFESGNSYVIFDTSGLLMDNFSKVSVHYIYNGAEYSETYNLRGRRYNDDGTYDLYDYSGHLYAKVYKYSFTYSIDGHTDYNIYIGFSDSESEHAIGYIDLVKGKNVPITQFELLSLILLP